MSVYIPGRGNKIIGVVHSALSRITDDYYFQNYIPVKTYCEGVTPSHLPIAKSIKLTFEDKVRRDVVTSLRSHLMVDFDRISEKYEIDAMDYFKKEISSLSNFIADGIVKKVGNKILATDKGAPFVAFACMNFDKYHPKT